MPLSLVMVPEAGARLTVGAVREQTVALSVVVTSLVESE